MVFLTGGAFSESSRLFAFEMKERCTEKPFTAEGLRACVNRRILATRAAVT